MLFVIVDCYSNVFTVDDSPLHSMRKPEEVEYRDRQSRPSVSMSMDDEDDDYPEEVSQIPCLVLLLDMSLSVCLCVCAESDLGSQHWQAGTKHSGRG